MALTRPDASQIAYGSRTLGARLGDYVSVKDHGAKGDGTTDDTAAITAAVAAAKASGLKRLRFPNGNYLISSPIVIEGSDWEIFGEGRTATRITQSANADHFQIDCRTEASYRGQLRDMELMCTSAAYDQAWGIHVVTDAPADGTAYLTLRSWTFKGLRARGVYHLIAFDDMGKIDNGGDLVFANGNGGFNQILDIDVPQYSRYPYQVVAWKGATGAHNIIWGGQYRSQDCGVSIGDGVWAIGDIEVGGIHFVTGDWAVKARGPSDPTYYNRNLTVIACQFDVLDVGTVSIDHMDDFRVYGNASMRGVGVSITNCGADYAVDDRGSWTLSGAYIPKVANAVSRVALVASDASGHPIVEPQTDNANSDLVIRGKGTGVVSLASHRANYLRAAGSNTGDEFARLDVQGAATNIALILAGKGSKGVRVGDDVSRPVGFYGSAGTTKQTVTGAKGGNVALADLITKLANLGLITDGTT